MLRSLVSEDISIELNLDQGLWAIMADHGNIDQIIINISVNSKEAMPDGGILTLKTENVTIDLDNAEDLSVKDTVRFICLTISDCGKGIGKKELENIFEPFSTTKELEGNTGLGLAVVYGIVKLHNGWIKVNSKVGEGTEFKIYIPAVPDEKVFPKK